MIERSNHVEVRLQQRAIPAAAIDLLRQFGATARSRGADSYFFDHAARRRARLELGREGYRSVERWLNAYAVISDDGLVITAAWRTRRLRRA